MASTLGMRRKDFEIDSNERTFKSIPIFRDSEKTYKSAENRRLFSDFEAGMDTELKQTPIPSKISNCPTLDTFSKSEGPRQIRRITERDVWFADLQRRFDDRRHQWDEDMNKTKSVFFFPMQGFDSGEKMPFKMEQPIITGYEVGEDGRDSFVVRFEVGEFDPNDIKAQMCNSELIIKACIARSTHGRISNREFTRCVELPKGVDCDAISAVITTDKWFVITCPIRQIYIPNASSHEGELKKVPSSDTAGDIPIASLRPNNFCENSVNSLPKFYVEIPIGKDFMPGEIQVKTLDNCVLVSARHEERSLKRSTFREFSKEYDVPEHIDPKSIAAKLEEGILYLSGLPFA